MGKTEYPSYEQLPNITVSTANTTFRRPLLARGEVAGANTAEMKEEVISVPRGLLKRVAEWKDMKIDTNLFIFVCQDLGHDFLNTIRGANHGLFEQRLKMLENTAEKLRQMTANRDYTDSEIDQVYRELYRDRNMLATSLIVNPIDLRWLVEFAFPAFRLSLDPNRTDADEDWIRRVRNFVTCALIHFIAFLQDDYELLYESQRSQNTDHQFSWKLKFAWNQYSYELCDIDFPFTDATDDGAWRRVYIPAQYILTYGLIEDSLLVSDLPKITNEVYANSDEASDCWIYLRRLAYKNKVGPTMYDLWPMPEGWKSVRRPADPPAAQGGVEYGQYTPRRIQLARSQSSQKRMSDSNCDGRTMGVEQVAPKAVNTTRPVAPLTWPEVKPTERFISDEITKMLGSLEIW